MYMYMYISKANLLHAQDAVRFRCQLSAGNVILNGLQEVEEMTN